MSLFYPAAYKHVDVDEQERFCCASFVYFLAAKRSLSSLHTEHHGPSTSRLNLTNTLKTLMVLDDISITDPVKCKMKTVKFCHLFW